MARQLTAQQQKFLDVLFDEAYGDVVLAKKLAGYSENTATTAIIDSLHDEIAAVTRKYMTRLASKAAYEMGGVLADPTQLGVKEKIMAAKDILDRGGIVRQEKVEVSGNGGIFVLPPKKGADDED